MSEENKSEGTKLQRTFTVWCLLPDGKQGAYLDKLKNIGSFNTVESFWAYYQHLIRPNDLPDLAELHVFQEGIRPMWEDPANQKGGKVVMKIKKGFTSKFWEEVLMALIGEQFGVGDEITGIVVSARKFEDKISLWFRSGSNAQVRETIKQSLRRIFQLNQKTDFEFMQFNTEAQRAPNTRTHPGTKGKKEGQEEEGADRKASTEGKTEKAE
mmetsp:Transcript_16639/g.18718  ORF Transcript_16639/g.18718 Transcript_16639/m.18718 type:complete len:212 (-) Transcript_16639:171-806(-)